MQVGDIARVPFPYVDDERIAHRPGLVVRVLEPFSGMHLIWVLMITSAENQAWLGDVPVGERYRDYGLPVPCVIRTAKVATIDVSHAEWRGRIAEELLTTVLQHVW